MKNAPKAIEAMEKLIADAQKQGPGKYEAKLELGGGAVISFISDTRPNSLMVEQKSEQKIVLLPVREGERNVKQIGSGEGKKYEPPGSQK